MNSRTHRILLAGILSAGLAIPGLCSQPPPSWALGTGPRGVPFDPGQDPAASSPHLSCGTSPGLEAWLESRGGLAPRRASARPLDGPPLTRFENGIIVMEDDGSLLLNDNLFDLGSATVELVPSGQGFRVSLLPLAYEADVGQQVFRDGWEWKASQVNLDSFAFPFGGVPRTRVWVTSTTALIFGTLAPPVAGRYCSTGCYFRKTDVLVDPTPRVAPLQHGTHMYGWNAWFREAADRAVFTWRASGTGWSHDVQAVLFADGRVNLNYRNVDVIPFGAAAVVTGDTSWWDELTTSGETADPVGDVEISGPDGPSMDFVSATLSQVSGSEVYRLELTLAESLPASTETTNIYYVRLRDQETDPNPVRALYLGWEDGRMVFANTNVDIDGNTLRFTLDRSELMLADETVWIDAISYRNTPAFELGDSVAFEGSLPVPVSPAMLDLSEDLPASVESGTVFEAFTLPELVPAQVYYALMDQMEEPVLDGVAIWQNYDTDIIFYAGGYSTGGNPRADGVGRGSSSDAEMPALLHLNNIYRVGSDEWLTTLLNHEFGHRWLYHFRIEEAGTPRYALNPDTMHPAGWVHTPAAARVLRPGDFSCMGGSNWTDNGDGSFTSQDYGTGSYTGYAWLNLYLMGLAGPQEVADWFYIGDTDPPVTNAYFAPSDITVAGTRVDAGVNQVIAAEGSRFPPYPASRSEFLVPFVLVVRPGRVTQTEIDGVADLCSLWSPRFTTATAERGSARCMLRPPDVRITDPIADPVVQPGAVVEFTGEASDADGDAVELTWDFSGVTPQTAGPGPHPVTFTTEGVFAVTLSGVDATGMRSPTPASLTVTVACDSPATLDEVSRLVAAKESPHIHFTWQDLTGAVADYVVLEASSPAALFIQAGSGASGAPGLLLQAPAATTYYEVAGRDDSGCLGPY